MTLQGSPWSAARPADPSYARFAAAWAAWLQKHPDGRITDAPGGAPAPGPIFSPEALGSPAVKRIVLKMLDPDPTRRIAIGDALATSYVKGIECCAPESCCGDEESAVTDAAADCCGKGFAKTVLRRHNHVPPREHRTPAFLVHRFDMGDGYR
jgi:hypothetical protein